MSRGDLLSATNTTLAALIAVPLAWYSAHYPPMHAAPAVSIKAEFGDMSPYGTQAATTVSITVTNTAATSVRLIGSMYLVSGVTVAVDGQLSTRGNCATQGS